MKLQKEVAHQFIKFCAVGLISTSLNYGFFYMLLMRGIHYLPSSGSGYLFGLGVGFLLNKSFTFRSATQRYLNEFSRYTLVCLSSLGVLLVVLKVLVFLEVHVLFANVVAIGVASVLNFFGSRTLVFKN